MGNRGIPVHAGPHLKEAFSVLMPAGIGLGPDGSPAERLDWRLACLFRHEVAASLFGMRFAGDDGLDDWLRPQHGSGYARTNALNLAMLPLVGVGRDCFWFNGGPGADELHDGYTLLDFDRSTWERSGADGDYAGWMLSAWARWLREGELVYGMLSLAVETLESEAIEEAAVVLQQFWPTNAVMEPLPEGGATLKFEPEDNQAAFGLALAQVHEEAKRKRTEVWEPFFASLPPAVTVSDTEEDGAFRCDVVFSNTAALHGVRPRRFLSDIALLQPFGDGTLEFIDREKRSLVAYAGSLCRQSSSRA